MPDEGRAASTVGKHTKSSRRAIVVVIALVLIGDGIAIGTIDRTTHPDTWDALVLPVVEFVERERGLLFKHPVHVDFMSDGAFRKVVAPEDELTTEEKAESSDVDAVFRALGLIGTEVDLFAEATDLQGDGTVGLYIPEE